MTDQPTVKDLINQNIPLAMWVAGRMRRGKAGRILPWEDLSQASLLGLTRAAIGYRPGRYEFLTYATVTCQRTILATMRLYQNDVQLEAIPNLTPAPHKEIDVDPEGAYIQELLAVLAPRQRRAVERVFLDGATRGAVSLEMGISASHLNLLIDDALWRMRTYIQKGKVHGCRRSNAS